MAKAKHVPPRAWAWMLEDGSLCYWAHPTKKILLWEQQHHDKPSPGAKPVCVRLVLNTMWGKIDHG